MTPFKINADDEPADGAKKIPAGSASVRFADEINVKSDNSVGWHQKIKGEYRLYFNMTVHRYFSKHLQNPKLYLETTLQKNIHNLKSLDGKVELIKPFSL